MEFCLIHPDKLKITLTATDMQSMELCYERMELDDPATRKALRLLLEQARQSLGFQPGGAKLFIEAYSAEGDGCVLYFTRMATGNAPREAGTAPVLYEFDDLETVLLGAAGVCSRYGHRIYKSSLYRLLGKYRLIILPLDYADRLSEYFLSEYGHRIGEGEIAAAFTEEHGKELIRDNAVEVLAGLAGDGSLPKG
jgi:negative regulator of genetic competence, sporulation and motility